ncbi:MAG: hypothetical protein AAGI44_06675 [Pseudomonadota bacterium]
MKTHPIAALLLLFVLHAGSTHAVDTTPPPVSGRQLSDAGSIVPADVLARVALLRNNVELIRLYMGRHVPETSLLRVTGAQPTEVYSQALNLESRANRLAFEQVRVVRQAWPHVQGDSVPADVYAVVDSALASTLLVKDFLGITEPVIEERMPESTTPTDVFNAIVVAGNEINNLLQNQTSPSDVFQMVTTATHIAVALHRTIPAGSHLPQEPAFVANKMPEDVLLKLQNCYQLLSRLAQARGVKTLNLVIPGDTYPTATPNDVSDIGALLIEQLEDVLETFPDADQPRVAYYPGRRFPSHVFQRAGLLQAILEELVTAYAPDSAAEPGP